MSADLDAQPPCVGHVAFSICSADTRHGVYDVLNNLVDEPKFSLTLRGQQLTFREALSEARPTLAAREDGGADAEADDATPPPPRAARKRQQDDWTELKACDGAPFRYEAWVLHRHPSASGNFGMDTLPSGALPVQ